MRELETKIAAGPMRRFRLRAIENALAWAADGGQALHESGRYTPPGRSSPVPCAHLFDQDLARLTKTARILGVRKVRVMRQGEAGQHVDLWGRPFQAAREIAGEEAK